MGVVVSAALVWAAVRDAELGGVGQALAQSNLWLILPFLVVLNLSYWLKAVRWRILLVPIREVFARRLFPGVMIGFASNIVLPVQLGELVRAWVVARQLDVKQMTLLGTIFLERIFDFLVVLVLLGCALVLSPTMTTELVTAGYFLSGICAVLLMLAVMYVRWTNDFLKHFEKGAVFLPSIWRNRIVSALSTGALGLDALRRPGLLVGITATSFMQWGLMGASMYVGIVAIGIDAPVSAGFVVLALTSAGMTLPSSPGYIGTIQLSFVLGLRPYGIDATDAFAASIYFHAIAYLYSLTLGLYYFGRTGYTLTQVRGAAERRE